MGVGADLAYWLALRRAGLGTTNFALLVRYFPSMRDAWEAPGGEILRAGVETHYARAIERARAKFEPDNELLLLQKHGARAVTWLSADYPERLREIPQSPPVVFIRGAAGPEFDQAVAVVGTRHVTPYGRQAAEHFCEALGAAGVAIVSGLARGVDAIAHRVALEQGAPTVGVLAGGIDQVYPRENAGLAERIVEHGCLVSEYPVGIPARRDYFPRRNRILAGLAKATLVVEAGEGSGALHTANWAFEQQRDVFAIPGSVFSRQSWGTNQLIRENTAKLVATPNQLLEELNLANASVQLSLARAPATAGAQQPAVTGVAPATDDSPLLRLLGESPRHADDLAREAGLPIAEVSGTLQILELTGRVRQTGPMMYARA